MVIITGCTGSGKTRCLQKLKAEVNAIKDWEITDISYIENPEEPDKSKILIVWDDCCGRYYTNPALWSEVPNRLLKLFKWVNDNSTKNHKAIVCLGTAEYNAIIVIMENPQAAANIASVSASLDFPSDNFVSKLKSSILKNLCGYDNCSGSVNDVIVEAMDSIPDDAHVSENPKKFDLIGIPVMLRLVCFPDIANNIKAFVLDPIDALVQVFEDTRKQKPMLYNVLIYAMLRGGNVTVEAGDIEFLRSISHDITSGYFDAEDSTQKEEEIRKLNEQFRTLACSVPEILAANSDNTFTFELRILFLCLFYHYFQNHQQIIVAFCDLDIILELLRPPNYDSEKYDIELQVLFGRTSTDPWCLEINERLYSTLITRDITKSTFENHPLQE